jgi:microcystin degradation protein MlrC
MTTFLLAEFMHETNTFSPIPTGIDAFQNMGLGVLSGQAAIDAYGGTQGSFGGFYQTIKDRADEIVVPVTASAWPSGKVTDEAYEHYTGLILDAVRQGVDAAFLSLHGAMVTETYDDAEGELLRRIREIAPDLPIAVSLDFHTSMGPSLCANATVVTGYRTYPHIDTFETAQRAATTLLRYLDGEVEPVISWAVVPTMTNMLRQDPKKQPMKDIMDLAIEAESSGAVLNASVLGGFPLSDSQYTGLAIVVVTDNDQAAGDRLRDQLAGMVWERRADFVYDFEPYSATLDRAAELTQGPIVLVDHGDNCGAGGTVDEMTVLGELLRRGFADVIAGPYCDGEAAREIAAAGVGATVTVQVGGKTDLPALGLLGAPLTVTGTVEAVSDGTWICEGPMMTGMTMSLGTTVRLRVDGIDIIIAERPLEPIDAGYYGLVGVDPTQHRYLTFKSRQHFRAAFDPIASEILLVAGPGVCLEDLRQMPFEVIRRPMFPFDDTEVPVLLCNA